MTTPKQKPPGLPNPYAQGALPNPYALPGDGASSGLTDEPAKVEEKKTTAPKFHQPHLIRRPQAKANPPAKKPVAPRSTSQASQGTQNADSAEPRMQGIEYFRSTEEDDAEVLDMLAEKRREERERKKEQRRFRKLYGGWDPEAEYKLKHPTNLDAYVATGAFQDVLKEFQQYLLSFRQGGREPQDSASYSESPQPVESSPTPPPAPSSTAANLGELPISLPAAPVEPLPQTAEEAYEHRLRLSKQQGLRTSPPKSKSPPPELPITSTSSSGKPKSKSPPFPPEVPISVPLSSDKPSTPPVAAPQTSAQQPPAPPPPTGPSPPAPPETAKPTPPKLTSEDIAARLARAKALLAKRAESIRSSAPPPPPPPPPVDDVNEKMETAPPPPPPPAAPYNPTIAAAPVHYSPTISGEPVHYSPTISGEPVHYTPTISGAPVLYDRPAAEKKKNAGSNEERPAKKQKINEPKKPSKAELMMAKMGYKKGQGLGKNSDGVTTHLEVKARKDQGPRTTRDELDEDSGSKGFKTQQVFDITGGLRKQGPDHGRFGEPSKVIVAVGCLDGVDMAKDQERDDGGIRQEIGDTFNQKFGKISRIHVDVSKPSLPVYVQFEDALCALNAVNRFYEGYQFQGRNINAVFYNETKFNNFEYDHE